MAKTTRYGGPSIAVRVTRAELGRVDQSAGTHSSELSEKESQSEQPSTTDLPEPAPTTENLSGQTGEEGTGASMTDGGTRKTGTRQSAKRNPRRTSTPDFD